MRNSPTLIAIFQSVYIPISARVKRKTKEEMKKQHIKEEPTFYVDRDRAGAVGVGSKDIKSELKVLSNTTTYSC